MQRHRGSKCLYQGSQLFLLGLALAWLSPKSPALCPRDPSIPGRPGWSVTPLVISWNTGLAGKGEQR